MIFLQEDEAGGYFGDITKTKMTSYKLSKFAKSASLHVSPNFLISSGPLRKNL